MKKLASCLVLGVSAVTLTGCGSSGGSDSDDTKLRGTAATGAAIQNQEVTAKCADGTGFVSPVFTNSKGEWAGEIGENVLPCALKINSPLLGSNLYSFANSLGTVNITPLTNMVVARATSATPDTWFNGADINISQSQFDAAINSLTSALNSSGFKLPKGNPVTTGFDIGDDWDEVLDDLLASIENSGTFNNYGALLTNFLEGNNSIPLYVDSDDDDDFGDDYDDGDSNPDYDLGDYTGGYDLTITTYMENTSPVATVIEDTLKPNSKSEFCVEDLYDDLKDGNGAYSWDMVSCTFSGNVGEIRMTTTIAGYTLNYRTTYEYSKR